MAAPRRTAVAWSRILRVLACLVLVVGVVSALNAGGSASAAVRSTSRLSVPVDGPVTLPETVDWSALESAGNSAISAYAAEGTADIESFLQQVSQEQQAGSQLKTEGQSFDQRENALTQQAESVKSQESALAQKGNQLDEAGQALDEKIAAHNAEKGSIDNTNAAAVDAYNQEADDLDSQRSNLDSEAQSIQDQQNQLDQEASSISSQTDQLNSDIDSYNQRVDAYNSALQQLEALAQQLVEQEAQAEQSATVNPPSPAVAMDDGGDAASPTGQATLDADQGVGDTGGDSPSAQPQIDALHEYAQQNGVRVLAQPGTATLTPGSVSELSATQAIQLGTPVGTYDGLAREKNGKYKAIEVQRPGESISPQQRAFESVINRGGQATATVQKGSVKTNVIINSFITKEMLRNMAVPPHTPPENNDNSSRREPTCLDSAHNPEDNSGDGWIENTTEDVEKRNLTVPGSGPGTRAGTATACLTKDLGEGQESAGGDITGWKDAENKIDNINPKPHLARCHLVANTLGGLAVGKDHWDNLIPCYHLGLNIKGVGMRFVESKVKSWIVSPNFVKGAAVEYVVTPNYLDHGRDSTIPWSVTMNVTVQYPTGVSLPFFSGTFLNAPFDPTSGPNLGN